ncbi:MAG: flavodoxin family protein [Chloroflexi bacterium]|nr:flavodoxin family protein [Chloroflexota bacterium]
MERFQMKVLGVCGSLVKGGNTEELLKYALQLAQKEGVETRLVTLADKSIGDCVHCNWCLTRQKKGKYCTIKDDMASLYQPVMEADILFLASPVYLGRLTGPLANFLDRIRCVEFGNIYTNCLADKIGAAFAVTWGRNAGVETALMSITEAFLMLDIVPCGAHMSPFGAATVSSIHGTGEFDSQDKLQVLKDEWGLNTTRMVVKRALTLGRIMKAGKTSLGNL